MYLLGKPDMLTIMIRWFAIVDFHSVNSENKTHFYQMSTVQIGILFCFYNTQLTISYCRIEKKVLVFLCEIEEFFIKALVGLKVSMLSEETNAIHFYRDEIKSLREQEKVACGSVLKRKLVLGMFLKRNHSLHVSLFRNS